MTESCGNCKMFVREPGNMKQGVCRLKPPTVFPIPSQGPGGVSVQFLSQFPPVQDGHWCGEWKPKLAS
jgi:hypothetical protein